VAGVVCTTVMHNNAVVVHHAILSVGCVHEPCLQRSCAMQIHFVLLVMADAAAALVESFSTQHYVTGRGLVNPDIKAS
jgi:hypothetical protein